MTRNFMVIISVSVKSSAHIADSGIMWHYHDVSYEKQHYVCTSSIHNEDILPVIEKFCSCLFFWHELRLHINCSLVKEGTLWFLKFVYVDIVSRLQVGWSGIWSLALVKRFFSSPNCPDQFWDQPNLVFSGCWGFLTWGIKHPRHYVDRWPTSSARAQTRTHTCMHACVND